MAAERVIVLADAINYFARIGEAEFSGICARIKSLETELDLLRDIKQVMELRMEREKAQAEYSAEKIAPGAARKVVERQP